jgi:hypothetical protein
LPHCNGCCAARWPRMKPRARGPPDPAHRLRRWHGLSPSAVAADPSLGTTTCRAIRKMTRAEAEMEQVEVCSRAAEARRPVAELSLILRGAQDVDDDDIEDISSDDDDAPELEDAGARRSIAPSIGPAGLRRRPHWPAPQNGNACCVQHARPSSKPRAPSRGPGGREDSASSGRAELWAHRQGAPNRRGSQPALPGARVCDGSPSAPMGRRCAAAPARGPQPRSGAEVPRARRHTHRPSAPALLALPAAVGKKTERLDGSATPRAAAAAMHGPALARGRMSRQAIHLVTRSEVQQQLRQPRQPLATHRSSRRGKRAGSSSIHRRGSFQIAYPDRQQQCQAPCPPIGPCSSKTSA